MLFGAAIRIPEGSVKAIPERQVVQVAKSDDTLARNINRLSRRQMGSALATT